MDFQKILLNGYFHSQRKHLDQFLYREMKKSEKEHYSKEEFIDGCVGVLNKWESWIKENYFKEHDRLINQSKIANSEESVAYIKRELQALAWTDFELNLYHYTKRTDHVGYILNSNDLLFIRGGLLLATHKAIKELNPKRTKKSLTLDQIALIYFYEDLVITRENSINIAEGYGYNSGGALYNKYCKWTHKTNRIGDEGTETTNRNKLEKLEGIKNHLSTQARKRLESEIKVLKTRQS